MKSEKAGRSQGEEKFPGHPEKSKGEHIFQHYRTQPGIPTGQLEKRGKKQTERLHFPRLPESLLKAPGLKDT